ncbi:CobQ/CobB/MinD/ParA nucleotide binding domain-containing protein [Halorientalis persicus]|uniref:CobQ/CobB/MinD/ParA nucleotide binding domain-containing protein n=1 Tax=Halorientalis persicus TaxID=1367881 RepID=A0A1H8GTY7_9EURY|nr:AAA family ATPase [Halorientalis persicus]SEN47249.1 CobQ/CobB/MinD/ParA nucleotide binding domain-containing protein [Halorientalis persicus]
MTSGSTLALAGVVGGAGTTRTTVEFGATLARAGRDVALLDAALATQGLAAHVPGRIDPDLTALCIGSGELRDGLVDLPVDVPGRLAACPARAPFERLARAKTPEAARRFESLLDSAAARFDHVLVDTPPVAANQAVAAVTSADRVALVVPATERGLDRVPTMRDRLRDLGATSDAVIATRADGAVDPADATIPESDVRTVADLPVSADPDTEFAPAVAAAVERVLDTDLGLDFPDEGLL